MRPVAIQRSLVNRQPNPKQTPYPERVPQVVPAASFLFQLQIMYKVLRLSLLRKHSGDLFLGQDNVFHGVLPALEVLRVVVHVGWEEELFFTVVRDTSGRKRSCVRQGITLVPVEALASLHATHQSRCAAVSEVYNGMLGLAQGAACGTQAWVSIPEFRIYA